MRDEYDFSNASKNPYSKFFESITRTDLIKDSETFIEYLKSLSEVEVKDFFERQNENTKIVRKLTNHLFEAQIKSFNTTAYCLTNSCVNSTYFDCHKNGSGSMVNKKERRSFASGHTIPSKAQLSEIAENNKIAWIPMKPAETYTTKPYISKDSISRILVSRGFCRKCDNDIFIEIDKSIVQITPKIALLLAYRCFAYKCWHDEVEANKNRLLAKTYQNWDQIKEETSLELREDALQKKEKQLEENIRKKKQNLFIANIFQDAIENKRFFRLKSVIFELERLLPYRFSGCMPLTLDFLNRSIEIDWGDCIAMPYVFIHILNVNQTSQIIISWLDYTPDDYAQTYIQSIRDIDSKDFNDAVVRYICLHNLGFAAKPSWTDKLTPEAHSFFIAPIIHTGFSEEVSPTPIPTPRILPELKIKKEKEIVIEGSKRNQLLSIFNISKLNFDLDYQPTDYEFGHLMGILLKRVERTWDGLEEYDFNKAVIEVYETLNLASRVGNSEYATIAKSNVWRDFGSVADYFLEFDIGQKAFQYSISLLNTEDPKHHDILGDIYLRLANCAGKNKDNKLAIESAEKAVSILTAQAKDIDTEKDINLKRAYSFLIASLSTVGDHDKAVRVWGDLFPILNPTDQAQLEILARTKYNLASSYTKSGSYITAYFIYYSAYHAYKALEKTTPAFFYDAEDVKENMLLIGFIIENLNRLARLR